MVIHAIISTYTIPDEPSKAYLEKYPLALLISGDEDSIRNSLMELNPAFVEMLPLTLEEMFINEMGGAGYEVF